MSTENGARPIAAAFALAICAGMACAAPQSLEEGLFGGITAEALPMADRREIAEQIAVGDYALTLRNGQVEVADAICAGKATLPVVKVLDLNGDGAPEVLVQAGNACSHGTTGRGVWLFVRQDGRWRAEINVVAALAEVALTRTGGWSDLHLMGRSHCIGLWTRAGGDYDYARSIHPDGSPCTP